jgi:exosortase D (VPLPA-CTERM-specific)
MASDFQNAQVSGVSARYQYPVWGFGILLALLVILYFGFEKALLFMFDQWRMEEFSHGYLIPFISGYLVWQRRHALRCTVFNGSWSGLAVVALGIGLDLVGRLTSIFAVQHIALLVVITGLVLAVTGWQGLRILRAPLAILVFMIPLPEFILYPLSSELQLVSSAFGVWLIRLTGVAVFLEGNVIDLGGYRLEVAQACSGLRYLLPLMTLAFLVAAFYRATFWKRALIFLSSIPITLLMNSLRIAAIGVMVDRWGSAMAEGLVHQVQGWMMFMLSAALLILEIALLTRVGRDRAPWQQAFNLESPAPLPDQLPRLRRSVPLPFMCSMALVLVFSMGAWAMPASRDEQPTRETFATFPLALGSWSGRRTAMEQAYLDQLKLDDYMLADYQAPGWSPINLYIAWYDKQSSGEATHSPRACLPGGGWRIEDLRQVPIPNVNSAGQPLRVNRALIQYDSQRELVYYWFQQRGRIITNEYLVKWYLLVDSVTRHRTDGALVRLVVPLASSMSIGEADRELQSFLAVVTPRLDPYVAN